MFSFIICTKFSTFCTSSYVVGFLKSFKINNALYFKVLRVCVLSVLKDISKLLYDLIKAALLRLEKLALLCYLKMDQETIYGCSEDSHAVMSEKVQSLAGSIYQEFEKMIGKYDEDVVKDRSPCTY